MKRFLARMLVASLGLYAASGSALEPEQLAELSLEELLTVKIARVDTDLRQLSGEAAAIYVITGDEIRRSGHSQMAEILRMVPGLHVARYNKSGWAVSARGFNGDFADKLEVLMDGRRLQTPLYFGVDWGLQGTFIQDIERIEVIRGPGGTLWGVNAVNGVINIVTRSARDTHGGYVYLGSGTEDPVSAGWRHGSVTDGGLHYRVWGRALRRDPSEQQNGQEGPDVSYRYRTGFRTDWGETKLDAFNLQGEAWMGAKKDLDTVFDPDPAVSAPRQNPVQDQYRAANLVFRWNRQLEDDANFSLQAYWDYVYRKAPQLGDRRNSYDLSFAHEFRWGDTHLINWGGGYLGSQDVVSSSFSVAISPASEYLNYWRLYAQDRLHFLDGQLVFTLGTKLDHNDFTGLEVQPNARLHYQINPDNSLWLAASRAVRSPARLDFGVRFIADQLAPSTFVAIVGSPAFRSETLWAYEAGYRTQLHSTVSTDLAVFYNDYEHLRTFSTPGTPFVADGAAFVPLNFGNENSAHTWGAELSMTWKPSESYLLRGGYTHFRMSLEESPTAQPTPINATEGLDPRHQIFLTAQVRPIPSLNLTGEWRYVDDMLALGVENYSELDLRAAWSFAPDWQLALTGRNLLSRGHLEYVPSTVGLGNIVEREGMLELIWQY